MRYAEYVRIKRRERAESLILNRKVPIEVVTIESESKKVLGGAS